MMLAAFLYTTLLFNLRTCYGFSSMTAPKMFQSKNCTNCRNIFYEQFEPLKRVAIVKMEILRRLGIHESPAAAKSASSSQKLLPKPERPAPIEYGYELSDILSYSEPPDNFTDDNIIQFKLKNDRIGRQLLVKSANLLIRVQYKKRESKQRRELSTLKKKSKANSKRNKKRNTPKLVDLVISTVDSKGKPDETLASVKSKLKRTKWLKLTLPQEVVQKAIDSPNKTFQVYIQCLGCGKRAKLILVHKKRKRKRAKTNTYLKLHKRRPMLVLHTRITNGRTQRSAQLRQCNSISDNCCKSNFVMDFESIGWSHWILSPKRYRTAFCDGMCSDNEDSSIGQTNASHNLTMSPNLESMAPPGGRRVCMPLKFKPLKLVYHNGDGVVRQGILPDMIVTKCGCRYQNNSLHD